MKWLKICAYTRVVLVKIVWLMGCNDYKQRSNALCWRAQVTFYSITYTAPHLARIINKSFAEGTVPNQLKVAKVCPIYKNGDATKVSNYRPISVLPSISKVFEKLVYNRLINYLTKFSILSNQQYGFRSNLSTSLAILEMVDKITDAIDSNTFSIGLFIDIWFDIWYLIPFIIKYLLTN